MHLKRQFMSFNFPENMIYAIDIEYFDDCAAKSN